MKQGTQPSGIDPERWEALNECALLGVRKTARALTQRYEAHLKPTGLRAAQFSLLAMLLGNSPASMGQLARWLVADRTTLTRVLKPLRARGLVAVAPGEDARVHEVSITAEGRALLDEALPLWEAAQQDVHKALGQGGLRNLLDGLTRVRRSSRSARSA